MCLCNAKCVKNRNKNYNQLRTGWLLEFNQLRYLYDHRLNSVVAYPICLIHLYDVSHLVARAVIEYVGTV